MAEGYCRTSRIRHGLGSNTSSLALLREGESSSHKLLYRGWLGSHTKGLVRPPEPGPGRDHIHPFLRIKGGQTRIFCGRKVSRGELL